MLLPDSAAEAVAFGALAVALVGAVVRPRGLPEIVFALPVTALLILVGAQSWNGADRAVRQLLPTVAFLALILVFGHLCAAEGVFNYLGSLAANASRGSPVRLLALVVALAAGVTAVLTLDATVVLLTPVVLSTVGRLGLRARPHVYACVELSNAGSLLLPVSNLTNLLAFTASGLSFGRFAALMALPWLLTVVLSFGGLGLFFRADLHDRGTAASARPSLPRFGMTVLALTVIGFVVASGIGVRPAWAALGGVLLLGGRQLLAGRITALRMVQEANLGFCAFVLCLGVIVDAVTTRGLHLRLPHGTSLPTLLALAFLAAAAANVVNNLPATLAFLPLVAGQPTAVLAVLIGVNIGPNATYAGSLATLLWRRLLPPEVRPRARDFHTYGALSVPVLIATSTAALWAVNAM